MTHKLRHTARAIAIAVAWLAVATPALSQPLAMSRGWMTSSAKIIIGIASFYDDPGETASGELYDPKAFTAAVQLDLRGEFGGIGFGKNYQPVYGIAEYGGKRAILKFNDVGPLKPGRVIDLSRAAMEHFDGIERGLIPEFKVTILPPGDYQPGPIMDEPEMQQPVVAERVTDEPAETAVASYPACRATEANLAAIDNVDIVEPALAIEFTSLPPEENYASDPAVDAPIATGAITTAAATVMASLQQPY
jgi:rare lipoprotein A